MRTLLFVAALAPAALTTMGCATLSERPPVPVPAIYHPFFGACEPADGAVRLTLLRDAQAVGTGEADWVAKPGSLELEMLDPVGRTMLRLKREQARLTATGPLAPRLPPLAVRKDGFLEVEGHMIGLKASELPCVLGGRLPRAWLALAREVDAETHTVTVADKTRVVRVQFRRPEDRTRGRICATFAWGGFAWTSHELVWCQHGPGRRQGDLKGDAAFGLELVRIDEEPRT